MMAGAMISLTFWTAFKTLLPCHLDLSKSRSSSASWIPEAKQKENISYEKLDKEGNQHSLDI